MRLLRWWPLSREALGSRKWAKRPIPVQPENVVEILVTPSPPSNARLAPSLSSGQQGADLHLQVVVHFTEGTTGVANPEVVDPSGNRSVKLRNKHPDRSCTCTPNDVAYLRFDCFAGLRSEEHTSELQSLRHLVCRLLL